MKNNSYYKMTDISSKVVRRNYSKINCNFEAPNLLDVQIESYRKFLLEELESVIKSISPIHSPNNKYTLIVNGVTLEEPKISEEIAKNDGKTYDAALYADVSILNNETGELIKARKSKNSNIEGIFFGNVPLMTKKGTFIINGIEKFVIAQIARSPGVYVLGKSQVKLNSSRKKIIEGNICEVLPFKGTLMIATINEAKNVLNFIMRDSSGETAPTFSASEVLKSFGLTENEIKRIFSNDRYINTSLLECVYQPSNIFNLKEIESLKQSTLELLSETNVIEEIEDVLYKGHKLERKLKQLVLEYVQIEKQLEDLTEELGDGSNAEIKAQLDSLNHNKNIIVNNIIAEKAAKDIVKKLSISLKVFDNNNIAIEDEKITYQTLLWQHFCSERYYDLKSAGRYKTNRKLRVSERLYQCIIAEDIKDKNGKIVFPKGTLMDKKHHDQFKQLSKNNELDICKEVNLLEKPSVLLFGEDIQTQYEEVKVYLSNDNLVDTEVTSIIGVSSDCNSTQLTMPDIISICSYSSNFSNDIGEFDDIDHLGNKRLKLIHELLRSKAGAAMIRIEKFIKEKLAICDGTTTTINSKNTTEETEDDQPKKVVVRQVINTKSFQLVMKDFFNSHQLTQFIDQQNTLSELTNKRRISAMGPGGISREDPNLDIRDVHYSHYGRICPIETPEGMNIGLVMSLASFAKINEHGFILTPYRKVVDSHVTDEVRWMIASQDDEYVISESNVKIDENNKIVQDTVVARFRGTSDVFTPSEVDYIDISPRQVVSIAASAIPFLENNDANRALMGSNMQRQAIPLVKPYAPIVGTGTEYNIAHDSALGIVAEDDGIVKAIDAKRITLKYKDDTEVSMNLTKFQKTNQNTCNNQTPIVTVGETFKKDDILCDGPAMKNGELALGQNILVGFTTWSGFNYEDAIILSEKLVKDDVYTSISIDEYVVKCLVTKNGDEEISREIPNTSEESKKYLNEDGIIMVGAEVKEGDILVGKVTPKGHVDLSPEEKLLQAIFGEKTKSIKDSSLRVPHSGEGIVAAVKRFRNIDDDLGDDVIEVIKIYVAQKRKIQIGDKMAGRHGNKGIVSKIVPIEDMPHLKDGTPLDVMLNPLGVPSRMNIGQILEIHLGLSAREIAKKELIKLAMNEKDHNAIRKLFSLKDSIAQKLYKNINEYISNDGIKDVDVALTKIKSIDIEIILRNLGLTYDDVGYKVATPVFAGCTSDDLKATMTEAGIDYKTTQGKFELIDGRTGVPFDGPISIGIMYMLKLDHMVDDKIHSRSVGPYSKITQQPLGGKSQNGGQRFGEMEVWALEAYGAAHNLREILTIKSDDVKGRNKTYSSIIKGKPIPSGSLPESFKLLVKQLQGLGLATYVIDNDNNQQDTDEYIKYENLVLSNEYDTDTLEAVNQFDVNPEDLEFSRPIEDFDDEE
ncbi:MAG: DNA-directed RNA polymerase subunit beta [Mycoplasma sp.]